MGSHSPAFAGAGPIPISACQKIANPGSYLLYENINATSGRPTQAGCIVISSPYVTINLAGFVISGDLKEPGIVYIASGGTITIKNGTVKLFSTAIQAPGAAVRLDGVMIEDWDYHNVPVSVGNNSLITNDRFYYSHAAPRVPPQAPSQPEIQVGRGSTVMANIFGQPPFVRPGPIVVVTCPSNVLFNNVNQGSGQISTSDATCNLFQNAAQ